MGGLLVVLLLGILPLAFFLLRKFNGDDCKSLPPGSTGWPFIGETFSYYLDMSSQHPRKFIDRRQSLYGDIFRSHLFGRKVIVSVDPQFNRFAMQNEGRLFQARYDETFVQLIGKYGLVSVHGELHRKLHGIAVNLFASDKLKANFMAVIEDLLQNTFAKWTSREILLQDECHEMLLNLMAKQLLDLSPSKETQEICRRFYDFTAAGLSIPIKIPGSAYAKGIKARDFLRATISGIIKQRKENPEIVHSDLLSKLMQEGTLSEEIIVDFILFLLFAGFETSSRAMAFSIKFLTECPAALQQLRVEHDSIQKHKRNEGNGTLTWDDYKSMTFTQWVINETLRLANVAPFICRETKEDIEVTGYRIPKGWMVILFMPGVHLDEKNFPAALTFNPWRWQEYDQDNMLAARVFTPFGGGARLCPGYHLARLEISLFLHHFVTKFRWEVLNGDKISNFPNTHLVKGFPIQMHPIESSNINISKVF